MAASAANDKLRKSRARTSTTLNTTINASDPTITPASTTGWPSDTAVTFIIDLHDSSGAVLNSGANMEVIRGELSGGNLINCVRGLDNTTAQSHTSGAVIELVPNASDWNSMVDWGLVAHNQDGTHKSGATYPTPTFTGTMTFPAGAVGTNDLSTSASYLGYAAINASASTSSATAVQVVGLSVTVTAPASRRMKITVYAPSLRNQTISNDAYITIWDGTVGSGTQLNFCKVWGASGDMNVPATCMAIVSGASGSKTYNVGLHRNSGGAAVLEATAQGPAFILVEAL